MTARLQHEFPRWEGDDRDPTQDVYAWPGKPRFVSAKRARKLRKRGVPLMPCHRVHDPSGEHKPGQFYPTHGDKARYCWFEPSEHVELRVVYRRLQCYVTATSQQPQGRKAWLRVQLDQQRERYAAEAFFRWLRRGHVPPSYERALQGALHEAFAVGVQTATGSALDALCGVSTRPSNMSDAELRVYAVQGYAVRVGHATPEQRAQRMSPPLTLFVPGSRKDS